MVGPGVSRRMSRHGVRVTVAGAALIGVAMLSLPVWAQDTPSAVQELDELRARAAAGEADAQAKLGFRYASGEGVAEDAVEAVRWFRLAAEQDHPDAQTALPSGWHRWTSARHSDARGSGRTPSVNRNPGLGR